MRLLVLLFAGCVDSIKDTDSATPNRDTQHTETDTDTDSDTDADTDTDADADVKYAAVFFAGYVTGDGERLSAGSWGFDFYAYNMQSNQIDLNKKLCSVGTDLLDNGDPAPNCPGCTFSYATFGAETGIQDGERCGDLMAEGSASGLGSYPGDYAGEDLHIGGAPNYNMQGQLLDAMLLYIGSASDPRWFVFSINYPQANYFAEVTGDGVSWGRVWISNSYYPYYFAYTP